MDKKALLLIMLEKLGQDRLPAQGLLILVKNQPVTAETIDALYTILLGALETVEAWAAKEKLMKWAAYLEQLLESEAKSKEQEQAELNELEALINAM